MGPWAVVSSKGQVRRLKTIPRGARVPLSIVHALAPAPFGGLETVLLHLATGLSAAGENVTVAPIVGPDEGDEHPFVRSLEGTDVRITPIELPGRGYIAERRAVGELLRRVGADVLHTHGYRPDVVSSGVAARAGVPRVTTVHGFTGGGGKNRLYEALQRRVFRRFDAVIAVSAKLERELVASGISADIVHVVRNAFPRDGTALGRAQARAKLGLPEGVPVVGWVGRLSPEKAPDIFVRAAATTAASDADVHFSVIGAGSELERSERIAAEAGVQDRVRFHGQVEGAGRLLPAFDVLALTSWTEGTPMVLLEAMSQGVPIVTTAVGGIPDVLAADEARLVEAGDVAGIGKAILDLLDDPELARDVADAARSRLERDFAVDSWIERHIEIYRSLVRS